MISLHASSLYDTCLTLALSRGFDVSVIHMPSQTVTHTPPNPQRPILQMAAMLVLVEAYFEWRGKHHEHPLDFPTVCCLLAVSALSLALRCITMVAATWVYVRNLTPLMRYNYVVVAIIASSFGKSFFAFSLVWDYEYVSYSAVVSIFVFSSNVVALKVGRSPLIRFPCDCATRTVFVFSGRHHQLDRHCRSPSKSLSPGLIRTPSLAQTSMSHASDTNTIARFFLMHRTASLLKSSVAV
jgi:hypothetical protein